MADVDVLKRNAAEAALKYVKPGMVLGLGTGSTARHFLEGLSRLIGSGMEVKAVPTSFATAEAAKRLDPPHLLGGTRPPGPVRRRRGRGRSETRPDQRPGR